jgi:acid stress-induced BolA-like protein IbaG/YrbA
MEEHLRKVLRELGFTDPEVQLERAGNGRVGGVLVSPRFAGQSQEERQRTLWDGLRAQMQSHELVQIVAIMTMTPEEIAA